jgi:hypothetical protein
MANKQTISEIVVNNVLAFITPFASKRLLKGVSLLLHKCCPVTITDVVYDCGTTDLTLTISPAQPLLGLGFAQVFSTIGGGTFLGAGTISADGTTITCSPAAAPVGVDQTITATIFFPTNTSNSILGVYQIATSGLETIVAC